MFKHFQNVGKLGIVFPRSLILLTFFMVAGAVNSLILFSCRQVNIAQTAARLYVLIILNKKIFAVVDSHRAKSADAIMTVTLIRKNTLNTSKRCFYACALSSAQLAASVVIVCARVECVSK
jgi:hypothetical protein